MDTATHHKILLLDDDPDLLDMYREILSGLPSHPDVRTSSSGPRAMAMLEADTYRLMICDLKMPKMDGLQVLSIVRRKHPELRTVVLTSVADEQFRSRVYALGVDLFWQKPATDQEVRLFSDCIESLLGRGVEPGFRGVHSKSLVDLIQLECISQSSSVLRITNGPLAGKIWITNGELVDSETEGATGEDAFKKILAWRAGSFESLPAEPDRPRRILNSYNALLLETAQEIDELLGDEARALAEGKPTTRAASRLAPLAQVEGVEFVLSATAASVDATKLRVESRGLENAERMGALTRKTLDRFRGIGERLHAGPLEQVTGLGLQRNVSFSRLTDADICVGWQNALSLEEIRTRTKKVLALWGF